MSAARIKSRVVRGADTGRRTRVQPGLFRIVRWLGILTISTGLFTRPARAATPAEVDAAINKAPRSTLPIPLSRSNASDTALSRSFDATSQQ
jgi:hypothetical protein